MSTDQRPELLDLTTTAREAVIAIVEANDARCPACGHTDFAVGPAMFTGYLFLDEEDDAYMVALTCRNPECPLPRTAVTVPGSEIMS